LSFFNGVFSHQSVVEDLPFLAFQGLPKLVDLPCELVADFRLGQRIIHAHVVGGKQLYTSYGTTFGRPNRRIERGISSCKSHVHRDDIPFGNVEALGDDFGRRLNPHRREPRLLFLQVEEQLSLGLRGAYLHQAVVVQDVTKNVGSNPPSRVARELHTLVRVILPHRLHEADVAFLNQVEDVLVRLAIVVGDLDDQSQVRCDQPLRRFEVVFFEEPHREVVLFLLREKGIALHVSHVDAERVAAGER
jgi:hypothetical protein